MCLEVVGHNNRVIVDVEQGQQSNNIQDLAAVRIVGSGNEVRGYAKGEMCALFINGEGNVWRDFAAVHGGIGDDVGAITLRRGSHNCRGYDTAVVMPKVQYPSVHGRRGVFIDDKTSRVVLRDTQVYGDFDAAVFSHGGDRNKVYGLTHDCKAGAVFAPYFETPDIKPVKCRATRVVEL